MSNLADITLIGAGVVGLAIASEVAGARRSVYVLEKNESFGQEQSSRNSEVIHAGIYYDKDSLKSRMCVEGNHLLYELCEKNGIAYKKCGKIVVATDEVEARELEKFFNKGIDNGAPLRMLSRKELAQLEPNMFGISAFFSHTTGIIDSHSLMRYFLGKAVDKGAQVAYKTKVIGIEKISGGYEISVEDDSGNFSFVTKLLINCAGLYSDKIAQIAWVDTREADYDLHWCKGEFYSVRLRVATRTS